MCPTFFTPRRALSAFLAIVLLSCTGALAEPEKAAGAALGEATWNYIVEQNTLAVRLQEAAPVPVNYHVRLHIRYPISDLQSQTLSDAAAKDSMELRRALHGVLRDVGKDRKDAGMSRLARAVDEREAGAWEFRWGHDSRQFAPGDFIEMWTQEALGSPQEAKDVQKHLESRRTSTPPHRPGQDKLRQIFRDQKRDATAILLLGL